MPATPREGRIRGLISRDKRLSMLGRLSYKRECCYARGPSGGSNETGGRVDQDRRLGGLFHQQHRFARMCRDR